MAREHWILNALRNYQLSILVKGACYWFNFSHYSCIMVSPEYLFHINVHFLTIFSTYINLVHCKIFPTCLNTSINFTSSKKMFFQVRWLLIVTQPKLFTAKGYNLTYLLPPPLSPYFWHFRALKSIGWM